MGWINKTNLLLAGVLGGGLYFASQHYTLSGWDQIRLESRDANAPVRDWADPRTWLPVTHSNSSSSAASIDRNSVLPSKSDGMDLMPTKPVTPTVRIASFDLSDFDDRKVQSVAISEILVRLLRNFDVIALQGITSKQRDTLPKLVDRINEQKLAYDYMIGPRVGPVHESMHLAFLYNTQRIETDRYQLYTVEDPGELLDFEPLVGWFRTKTVSPERALTFSLVNLYLSPTRIDQEINLLAALSESIQRDGRGEDDIVLAGGFSCSDKQLGALSQRKWGFAIENLPTTVAGDEMLDQIVFSPQTADEFTGRAGVIDFLRKFNLTLDQANQVSRHLPVWCEFFAEEGGYPGYQPQAQDLRVSP
ncbi:MAG: endonuclease/exonuclease/phosphatase [Planctomycetota bacterium]|nr:endonuclease/exonuclease/phosphatase [Planctomycetota bacterium]